MGSLRNIPQYLYIWQMPLVLLFLACWLGLGSYLLLRSMQSHKHWVKGTVNYVWACKRMFLVGLVAGGCGIALMGLVVVSPLSGVLQAVVALVVAWPLMTFVGITTLSTLLHQPMSRGVAVGLRPVGLVAMSVVVLLMVGYLPARAIYHRDILREQTNENLRIISRAIESFAKVHGRLPESLEELVERKKIDPEYLRSAVRPDLEIGYFYMPAHRDTHELMAISYPNPHVPGRAIMTVEEGTMHVQWEERDVDWRLEKWASGEFRQALKEAEATLPPAPKP